jgi:hypothetical protein
MKIEERDEIPEELLPRAYANNMAVPPRRSSQGSISTTSGSSTVEESPGCISDSSDSETLAGEAVVANRYPTSPMPRQPGQIVSNSRTVSPSCSPSVPVGVVDASRNIVQYHGDWPMSNAVEGSPPVDASSLALPTMAVVGSGVALSRTTVCQRAPQFIHGWEAPQECGAAGTSPVPSEIHQGSSTFNQPIMHLEMTGDVMGMGVGMSPMQSFSSDYSQDMYDHTGLGYMPNPVVMSTASMIPFQQVADPAATLLEHSAVNYVDGMPLAPFSGHAW